MSQFKVLQSVFSFVFRKTESVSIGSWTQTLQTKTQALQERTEIFKPSQKHGVEVWDYGLSGQLEKKTRAVTGRRRVWQARFASGRCWAGGSGLILAASSRFVGLSCLLRELLWETCKVKGLLVKRARKWIRSERLTQILVAAGSSPRPWALLGPRWQAAPFCFASHLSWRPGGAQDLH